MAIEKSTLKRALKVAFPVGIVLNLINNFEQVVHLNFGEVNMLKVTLTFFVPFFVSTYSSIFANLSNKL